MATDRELDGVAQTRLGGFFNARKKRFEVAPVAFWPPA
jgi:hypothetical protein